MSLAAASFMYDQIEPDKDFTLCPAAGRTPSACYRIFVSKMQHHKKRRLKLIMLDEWLGLPVDHPASCRHQIENQLIKPLSIQQHFIFDCNGNPDAEINRFREIADRGIDLCVLGLGKNGHIGLNEPASTLQPYCHQARLSRESLHHPMLQDVDPKPEYGITLGMQEILAGNKILLLVSGKEKQPAFLALRRQEIDTQLPASFLWLHNDAHCYFTDDVTRMD
ncbi:MAG: galactosamine-6-phosphate isomerase [Saprospiraceae bacterium]|nr:galactosamine-6-phosphate isomerase [Saprospiraceae bacterium]